MVLVLYPGVLNKYIILASQLARPSFVQCWPRECIHATLQCPSAMVIMNAAEVWKAPSEWMTDPSSPPKKQRNRPSKHMQGKGYSAPPLPLSCISCAASHSGSCTTLALPTVEWEDPGKKVGVIEYGVRLALLHLSFDEQCPSPTNEFSRS